MKIRHLFVAALLLGTGQAIAQQPLYKQANAPIEERIKDLMERMTVEEKVGQLCCPMGWEMYTKTGNKVEASELYKKQMGNGMPIGSYWAVLRADPWTQKTLENGLNPELAAEALNKLQKFAVEETRLGIPYSLLKKLRTDTWRLVQLYSLQVCLWLVLGIRNCSVVPVKL